MILSVLLHFYQPTSQQFDILERIVNESYRPLLKIFLENPKANATFNVNAGLLELFEKNGYHDLIDGLKQLLERGQIELTGCAKYHPILPLIPAEEIKRQITLNSDGLKTFLGKDLKFDGFFPPELAYSPKVAKIIEELGYKWMALPMVSFGPQMPEFDRLYKLKKSNLMLYFRHKWVSNVILSGYVRSREEFKKWLSEEDAQYMVAVMDAETFGHHRPGLVEVLASLIKTEGIETLRVSDLDGKFRKVDEVEPREATWSNSEQDFWLDKEQKIARHTPFLLWSDPNNPIHKLQWELTNLAIKTAGKLSDEHKARHMLDMAIASDQFWWASAKPWWSLEMIEAGAFELVQTIKIATDDLKIEEAAQGLYRKILDQAFEWQRTGYIRKMHLEASDTKNLPPFKERAPKEWYNQIILEFTDEMQKAANRRDFEAAIKWRDAIYKLDAGVDVYDILHVINELHTVRRIPSLKPFLVQTDKDIPQFAKRYLESLTPEEIKEGRERLKKQGFKI
ncbi:MAG TPA: polysaccharide deacetylase family protein [Patescibacteria group bacterium]